jgi:hypothetical protein
MTERRNQEHKELDNLELDAVYGGLVDDAGCCGPWIVDGRLTMHQPSGPNPYLPGGIFHRWDKFDRPHFQHFPTDNMEQKTMLNLDHAKSEVFELTDAELDAINGGNWVGDAFRAIGSAIEHAAQFVGGVIWSGLHGGNGNQRGPFGPGSGPGQPF